MKHFRIVIFILLSLNPSLSFSQKGIDYGIKMGLLLSKLSLTQDINPALIEYPIEGFRYLGIDLGVYLQFFNTRKFCVTTEFHYNQKGESTQYSPFRILYPISPGGIPVKMQSVNNAFEYLYFQILPRWKFLSSREDYAYLFAGPRFDYRISNSNTDGPNEITFKNGVIEGGFTTGFGYDIMNLFNSELRYDYSFTNAYSITNGVATINRNFSSFTLLLGISIKELFHSYL